MANTEYRIMYHNPSGPVETIDEGYESFDEAFDYLKELHETCNYADGCLTIERVVYEQIPLIWVPPRDIGHYTLEN